jgi:hypothetical protein
MSQPLQRAPEPDTSEPRIMNVRAVAHTRSGHDIYLEEPDARKEPATATRLVVRGPSGEIQLKIELTADGPVLRFHEAALELQVEGNLRIESERLSLHGRSQVEIRSGGDLQQHAQGHLDASAGGRARLAGHDVRVAATRGDVGIKANDDVRVDGERIWLNR